jgi:hypothetical protein
MLVQTPESHPESAWENNLLNDKHHTALGLIEGFFGRSWSWQERSDYATFLATAGYQFYIYAPKSDSYLRKHWQQDWPDAEFDALRALRESYRAQGVQFGIGLSPYEIYCNPDQHQRAALTQKLERIDQLEPDILCLLFDDMRGDLPGLAQVQCELVKQAADASTAQRLIFCPTYYSFDPVLEKVFGQRPQNYWQDLGSGLDKHIDIFWTGPKVCSPDYPVPHLQEVSALLERKPFLWDNYPVNDGAVKARHLHLRAFGESHAQLAPHIAGHAVNPMNQPWLSRIPLLSLPKAYREGANYNAAIATAMSCQQICGKELVPCLLEDISLLQDLGLQGMTEAQKRTLFNRYQALAADAPWANEICEWLSGGYAFDPACLTE